MGKYQGNYFSSSSDSELPSERPTISESSIPPMPSRRNPVTLQGNNRLKKMYLKNDHVYLSDSDFSDDDDEIQFPYNTTSSKYYKNGLMDNIVGKKKVVTFVMPKKDAMVLRRAKKYAKKLDYGIGVGKINVPIDPLLGFIPGIGDFAGIFLGLGFIGIAQKAGLDKKVYSKMIGNLVVDSLVGLIPALGDVADFFHKANMKNFKVLEKYLIKRSKDFTKMINGDLEPKTFYNKYKSFASHHKKDIVYLHENLGVPLPSNWDGPSDPLPSYVGPDEDLEDIENEDGLFVVDGQSNRPPHRPTHSQDEVVVTNIQTSTSSASKRK